MPRILLNRIERPSANLPESWGELLDAIAADAAGRGEVVSAVRFDGVDEPAFPEAALAGRALRALSEIEIETATPGHLLAAALEEGATAAANLASAAGDAVAAFRGRDIVDANGRLAAIGEGTRSLLAVLSLGADVAGASLDTMPWDGRPASARLRELAQQVETIIEAQQTRDWLTIADVLEYDLRPALETAVPVFAALRGTVRV